MKIRQAKRTDLESIARIYTQVYNQLDIGEEWTKRRAFELLEYYFFKHPELAFTAKYDDKLVGAFFAGIKPWWDGYHLFDGEIFVRTEYRGHGIGRALLKAVLAVAKEKYDAVCWDAFTFTGRRSPLPWYKKLGISPSKGYSMMSGNVKEVLSLIELRERKKGQTPQFDSKRKAFGKNKEKSLANFRKSRLCCR
jgi:GNAT superfamily N-acetyltransferase